MNPCPKPLIFERPLRGCVAAGCETRSEATGGTVQALARRSSQALPIPAPMPTMRPLLRLEYGLEATGRILNIAAYLFTHIEHPAECKPQLLARARELALKGTVLLAREGIILFLAGEPQKVELWLSELMAEPLFAALKVKRQHSNRQPFARMKVKVKRELVPLGERNLPLEALDAARITPVQLRQWLDQGRKFVLLDTRNQFEFEQGTFNHAQSLGLRCFRDFPSAVEAQLGHCREQPIVAFCTGGIRCEKAAPLMQQLGFSEVYQLDGGILNYFAECGSAHYQGDCFVFDERIGVDSALAPSEDLAAS